MSKLRKALEDSLVENPDDLATHMAYADHLHDEGDLRGDLIQVQLALENESLSAAERSKLKLREDELLKQTRDSCLGEKLAKMLKSKRCDPPEVSIRRGWLDSFVLSDGVMEEPFGNWLAAAPEARLLRELGVGYLECPWFGKYDANNVPALYRSKNLKNLRKLHLGNLDGFEPHLPDVVGYNSRDDLFQANGPFVEWFATMPRLEEFVLEGGSSYLTRLFGLPLPHLRLLKIHLADDYPADVLARNATLGNLTHLSFHPCAARDDNATLIGDKELTALAQSPHLSRLSHLRFQKSDAGDLGLASLVESPLMGRLRFLDLAMGSVTDTGAELLAGADLRLLEVLDLSRNQMTRQGIRRLREALPKSAVLRVEDQFQPGEVGDWLTDGEME